MRCQQRKERVAGEVTFQRRERDALEHHLTLRVGHHFFDEAVALMLTGIGQAKRGHTFGERADFVCRRTPFF